MIARLKKSDNICAASAMIAKLFDAIPPAIYQMKKILHIHIDLVLILSFAFVLKYIILLHLLPLNI